MSRTYHHDAKHRTTTATRRRNRRGHPVPTAEQRVLELLAQIPTRAVTVTGLDHTSLAAYVIPDPITRPHRTAL